MIIEELNELVKDFNEEKCCIRFGKDWDMTLYSNSHIYLEGTINGNLKVINKFLGLIILNIFDIEDYSIIKLRNGDYQIYKEENESKA